ncbi:MAG TPA: aminotransferase class I/II-fold pyridoxal phosphate-dependent enzyme [Thermoanaerobaculaceae bacterium]|nr:aminotransferase class I/II-fold pyridoxal phosphate-dependent enzyme [Thermoanaerobaculaceae bacterium]
MLSERANRIALSPTLRINARATQMRGQGIDVVDFSVGEPDFPTPEVVKRAAKAALDANFTKYTANDGIPDLKKAICGKLERDNGLAYSPDEIIVSAGAKNSLFNVAMALYDEGDDILIPAPYWVSYPDQVKLAKANPVIVPTREEDGFRLQARDLAAAITPNTKAIILNYPCNPSGATYTREQLEAIAEVCVREQIWVISDEIYEKLTYDGQRFVSIASLNDKIKKLTVVINGFSKAFSMTGWRLGYAAGPREIVAACSKIQSHNTSNATSFVQKAAVTALAECDMDVERMRQEFERRRNAIVYRLRALPEVSCASPSGAFYVLPNVTHYLDREFGGAPIRNSYGLAYYLLKEAHVAVVPGEAFGTPAHVRISFATAMDRIEEGCRRIREALARLEAPRRLRPRALNNIMTKVAAYAETRPVVGLESRNALLDEASSHLAPDAYFEWNAAIAGIVVQLRTNSPHLADFYQENFYPAALEGDLEPHAVIYAVKDIPGREAAGLVSLETATGFAFNTAFYGQVRTLALQLASEAAARTSGALLAHCAALDVGGHGALVWGGPGSGRTGLLAAALREDGVRLVSSDAVLVRLGASEPVADLIERKLYLKAKWVGKLPEIGKLLERSKLENMVVSRDGCTVDHPGDECPLDRGAAVCVEASRNGRVMLDPYWLGGAARHARRTVPHLAVLLARDPVLPMVQQLDAREAARILASGQLPGAAGKAVPFANPHLAGLDATRSDLLRAQHERLFAQTKVVLFNTAIGSADAAAKRVLELCR